MKDGLLSIELRREIPEAMKPRKIEINGGAAAHDRGATRSPRPSRASAEPQTRRSASRRYRRCTGLTPDGPLAARRPFILTFADRGAGVQACPFGLRARIGRAPRPRMVDRA